MESRVLDSEIAGLRILESAPVTSPCSVPSKVSPGEVVAWRGQIKLDIYRNSGLITVHILAGRYFNIDRQDLCRSGEVFVKVARLQSGGRPEVTLAQSRVQLCANPTFDQKVTIESGKVDRGERILISLWTRTISDGRRARAKLLGCTSFGLRAALSKRTSGWFHLLSKEVGLKKHVKAMDIGAYRPEARGRRNSYLKSICKSEEQLVFLISRGPRGFGFCLSEDESESRSVRVSLVDPSSPAFASGLLAGDTVVAVNGENVQLLSCDAVLQRIRACRVRLEVCVQRSWGKPTTASRELYAVPPNALPLPPKMYRNSGAYENVPETGEASAGDAINDDVDEGFDSGQRQPAAWNPHSRRDAIRRVVQLEEDFVWRFECRHELPQDLQLHVNELIEISRSHLNQIQASADYSGVEFPAKVTQVENLGQIYRFRIFDLCDTYKAYSEALQLCHERRQTSCSVLTPRQDSTFVRNFYRPLEHLNLLLKELRVVLNNTSADHPDRNALALVVTRLEICCRVVFPVIPSNDGAASVTTESSQPSDASGSVDSELIRIQQKLNFEPPLQAFNLCQPQRHLIYSSDLFMMLNGSVTLQRVFVLLFSDLLLITEKEEDESLTVLQEALFVRSCASANFSLIGSQFSISFAEPNHHIVFRAPTYELKIVWKNLFMQRLEYCS